MNKQSFSIIILAAGKGTRMKSAFAKVTHGLFFKPMIHHVLDALSPLCADHTVVVTGHQADYVEQVCSGYNVSFVRQQEQLGTGHAVGISQPLLQNSDSDVVMILCGDTPLIRTETLQNMLFEHLNGGHTLSVMTTIVEDPTNYGRIILADSGFIQAIVEEKDANAEQRKIREINAGIYCVDKSFLFEALKNINTDNKQGELYLTDIVAIAYSQRIDVKRFFCRDVEETLGVNSRRELAIAHSILQKRYLHQLMDNGVTCMQPDTLSISGSVMIGRDTVIAPNVVMEGKCSIGENCFISSFSYLNDCKLGDNVKVCEYSYLNGIDVADNTHIPPRSLKNK